jgi:subtilisin family serine protease
MSHTSAKAPEPADSYIVIMAADPVAQYEGEVAGLPATSPEGSEKLDADAPAVQQYVAHIESEQDAVLADIGVPESDKGSEYAYAVNGFEAKLTETEVAALQRRPEVARVVKNELRQKQTEVSAARFLSLDVRGGLWQNGITGTDVVVGVIDSGIWPEHPSISDDYGAYSELPSYAGLPCEFGDEAYNPNDKPFECNNKLLGARDMRTVYKQVIGPEVYNSARDYDGHGTHTATTIVGNELTPATLFGRGVNNVSGIAPRARLIVYSAGGELGFFSSDLVDSIDQAVADGVDVINYSIGGGPSLTSPDDLAFLGAADANVWAAVSNSNDGPGAGTGGGPASVPWVTAVGASSQSKTYFASVRLGNGERFRGTSVTGGTGGSKRFLDGGALGNLVCDPDVDFAGDITDAIVLCQRGGVNRVDKSRAVFEQGGAGMILYNLDDDATLLTDPHFVPSAMVTNSDGLAMRAYISSAGADARAAIGDFRRLANQGSVMADFSSRGPNPVAPDIIKPDITAPGINILAGNTPTPVAGPQGELFQVISGTSMSGPHIAGIFALLREVHPDWTAAMAKSAVMTTSRQNVFKEGGTRPADPFDMGAGHVDPSGRAGAAGTLLNPGLVYDAGFLDYLGFLCDAEPTIFANPTRTCSTLEANGVPTEAYNLNYPSIGASAIAGSITVERTVTSVAAKTRTWKADVDAPEGFDVTVSPAIFTIAPGATQAFTVTITNVSAPVDEWRFGSLTWESGKYDVYSPIAANAVAFAAPAVVSGTGVDGTATFPVQFGYTGAYAAAPHGLVAEAPVPGRVAFDTDQTFDPLDPEGTTAHAFTTNGSAYLRIALGAADLVPPNPNHDIDLYLLDSSGNVIATSTAGGTDELIEVVLPADGTYTLYVHGWQVVNGPIDYTLHTWDVPATPGTGPLAVTSAPTSATLGQRADIGIAWSGLTAGVEYYGAVSHADDAGLLGLTLVNVAA